MHIGVVDRPVRCGLGAGGGDADEERSSNDQNWDPGHDHSYHQACAGRGGLRGSRVYLRVASRVDPRPATSTAVTPPGRARSTGGSRCSLRHRSRGAAVGLIADAARDGHPFRPKLRVKRVGVFDPDVCVPGVAPRVGNAVGAHGAHSRELAEHDDDPAALDHAERRRVAPQALVVEAKRVPVIVGGSHHVIHDEVRRDGPARANAALCPLRQLRLSEIIRPGAD